MGKLLRGILVFNFVAIASLTLNAENSHARTEPPKIAAAQVKKMNLDELVEYITELEVHWRNLGVMMKRTEANDLSGLESLFALREYENSEENIAIAIAVLKSEVKRAEGGNFNMSIIVEALKTLMEIGSFQPVRYLEELETFKEEVSGRLVKMPALAKTINDQIELTINTCKTEQTRALSLEDLLDKALKIEGAVDNRMAKYEAHLRKKIMGQPELIDLMVYLQFRSLLYGGAVERKPDVIYTMGLFGTGKDTSVRAWVDAIHGIEGAWKNHLFSLPTMKNESDLWKVLGSATGYVGSGQTPPFLEFLVQHSGGKYAFQEVGGERGPVKRIVLNPAYKGETLPGYYPPESAVVFANEFHNWSRQSKDDFLKQAIEHGYFTINNPNGGLAEIYVPVRFFIASNDGIDLLTAREANGQRVGKPLPYPELLKKWETISVDKLALRSSIMSGNGDVNDSPRGGTSQPGTSEEFLNRISDRNLILLRPLSPEDLKKVAQMKLEEAAAQLKKPSEMFKSVEVIWDQGVVDFVQGFHYNAEDNARPIGDRVLSLVEEPLVLAVKSKEISADPENKVKIEIDIKDNADGTKSLLMQVTYASGKTALVERVIAESLQDKIRPALTDERIDELADFASNASEEVFGVDGIVERLGDRVMSIANDLTAGPSEKPANAIGVFGLTSTGKTELAKKTAKGILGSESELLTLDFSQIQSMHDFKTRILGLKDARGNPIASDFMKAYDRNNGLVVVAADEIANVKDPDLLRALYDFFREPIVTTFSDGKPRPMGGVFVIVTGNAGQEIFAAVPNDIPDEVKMSAWKQISDKLTSDVNLQLEVLERYLPWPLIARLGKNNIFFVPPHTYKSLRQLAQLKLGISLKRLANSRARRGWKITFANEAGYSKFVDQIVEEGFTLRHQGASIDSFVRGDFETVLGSLLLKNKVPADAHVVLEFDRATDNSEKENPGFLIYKAYVDGYAQPLELKIQRPYAPKKLGENQDVHLLTAYHEAGHSLVRQALFGDIYRPVKISIIPGVSQIGGEWVYYAGVASNEMQREVNQTRDYVIRQIAVWAAGETAERLVSRGSTHSTGKSNDSERAARLARDAVLKYGLSEKWGTVGVPAGEDVHAYMAGLSNERKLLLEQEIDALVNAGRRLARETLEANYHTAFLPLGVLLAEKGLVDAEGLETFYKEHPVVSSLEVSRTKRALSHLETIWRGVTNPASQSPDTEIYSQVPKPPHMANIEEMAIQEKQALFSSVALPQDLPVGVNEAYQAQGAAIRDSSPASCTDLLTGRAG